MTEIRVEKLTPHIGAVIHGVDLSRPLGEVAFKRVHQALMDNLVIFFRDQEITPEQHKAFGRLFGELHIHPAAVEFDPASGKPRPHLTTIVGHPEIIMVYTDERSSRSAGENWHSDVSSDPEPPMGSILHLKELPPVGGDTLFANMYIAYETLSESFKRFLEPLTAYHDGNIYGKLFAKADAKEYTVSEHPVITTHPVTGKRALFVNSTFTSKIVQLSQRESDAVLECLFRHIETAEFQCRFKWAKNSIAFWDNRCAQHHAMWDYYPNRRMGHRVTITGQRPLPIRNELG